MRVMYGNLPTHSGIGVNEHMNLDNQIAICGELFNPGNSWQNGHKNIPNMG